MCWLRKTTKLGQAYGVCVILVTFITTFMVSLVAIIIWRLPIIAAAIGFIVFGAFDGMFLSSALTKVPEGAWFTLALALILSSVFILWRFGKENQWRAEASDRIPLSQILTAFEDEANGEGLKTGSDRPRGLQLTPAFGNGVISPIQGMGIFFDKTGSSKSTPTVFIHFLQKFQAAPAIVVFFHIRALSSPTVPAERRFTVTRSFVRADTRSAIAHGFYRITLRHGYMEAAITRDLGKLLYDQLRGFVIREEVVRAREPLPMRLPNAADTASSSLSITPDSSSEPRGVESAAVPSLGPDPIQQDLHRLESAYQHQAVYIVGKEQMRVREDHGACGWTRRISLSAFVWLRENTGSRVRNLNVDVDKLVEMGFVKVI